jgi:hypothetical protein
MLFATFDARSSVPAARPSRVSVRREGQSQRDFAMNLIKSQSRVNCAVIACPRLLASGEIAGSVCALIDR